MDATCSNFYSGGINKETVKIGGAFTLTGPEKSGLSTAVRCANPNVFAVNLTPIVDQFDQIRTQDDFFKFALTQAARRVIDLPVSNEPTETANVKKYEKSLERVFNYQTILGLCSNFPADASKSDISKLANHVKSIVDVRCDKMTYCSADIKSTTILEETQSVGVEGALEILERAKTVLDLQNSTINSNPEDLLLYVSSYIEAITGQKVALRLDASDVTDKQFDFNRLAELALNSEIQGKAMDRDYIYQYAFPEGTNVGVSNQKLPNFDLSNNTAILQQYYDNQQWYNSPDNIARVQQYYNARA